MSEDKNKRLIKNSITLYFRMLLTMVVNLYTTRILLNNLGTDDYGTYNVVGSVVTMFTLMNSSLLMANQRFISYEFGVPNGNVNRVFSSLLNITFVYSLFIFLLLESIGLWFLNTHLNIPEDSKTAALWVFQFSIVSLILNLVSNPYNALVIAHEKMNIFACVTILQVILNFFAAYSLSYINDNKLFWYGLIIMIIYVIIRLIYQIYCRINFKESIYHFILDKRLLKNIGKFVGWTTVDGGINTFIWTSFTWIFNIYFGVAINAVYNISNQIKNSILSFAQNIQRALEPQIISSYSSKDYNRHRKLVYIGSKSQLIMVFFIVIPFLVKTEYIMNLWLGNIPQYCVEFAQLSVFMSILNSGYESIRTSVTSTGNIKKISIIPNIIFLLIIPTLVIISKFKSPILVMLTIVIGDYIAYGIRLYLASKVSCINLRIFNFNVVFRTTLVFTTSFISSYFINYWFDDSFIGLTKLIFTTTIIISISTYLWGINNDERRILNKYILVLYSKLRKR